ncbi:hypothetical protein B0E33_06860 [Roseibium algicola]|uniref:Uncharacterized protein n=1 Tax=Roseibium algicola TaxID=2857014 RepID=A0ABM6HZM7_9HYPH|nr:hypothetical protein B0E33_06860 [Roseibium aggregatum]
MAKFSCWRTEGFRLPVPSLIWRRLLWNISYVDCLLLLIQRMFVIEIITFCEVKIPKALRFKQGGRFAKSFPL